MFMKIYRFCAVLALLALIWAQWHGYSVFEESAGRHHGGGHGSSSRTYHK